MNKTLLLLIILATYVQTSTAGVYDTKYYTVAKISIASDGIDFNSKLNGTDIKDFIQSEVTSYLQSQAAKAVDYVVQTFISVFQDSDALFDDLSIINKFNSTPVGRRLLQWLDSANSSDLNSTNSSSAPYTELYNISTVFSSIFGTDLEPDPHAYTTPTGGQEPADQDLHLPVESSPQPVPAPGNGSSFNASGYLETSEDYLFTTTPVYSTGTDASALPGVPDLQQTDVQPAPEPYQRIIYYRPGDEPIRPDRPGSHSDGASIKAVQSPNYPASNKALQSREMLDFWRSFSEIERHTVTQGLLRRRLLDLVAQSQAPQNSTYVLVALQSQSWDQMQLLTSTLNSNLFAQQINSRQLLQVNVLSSTTSLVVPGEAEALNVLTQSSPSLQILTGLAYSNATGTWISRVKHFDDPTNHDFLQAIYFTKSGGIQPGDRLNPCLQPTSTVNCIYDMQIDYYTGITGLPTTYSTTTTAKQLIESLPNRSFMEIIDNQHGIRSYYASEDDLYHKILTIELTQTGIESYIGTLSQSNNALNTYRFGIGMLMIRSNPTTLPDAIVDFSIYEVLSTNHYTFSVKSTQDYTFLQYFSATLNKVLYPSPSQPGQNEAVYFADINFVIPDGYQVDTATLKENVISYIGTDQRTFSDANVWINPCLSTYEANISQLLTEECKQQVQLDFCSPIVHDFMNRPGVFVTVRIPFKPDETLGSNIVLYTSILLKVFTSSVTDAISSMYTNIVTSVRLGNYVTHCQNVLLPALNFDFRFVKLQLSIGLSTDSPFTSTVTVKDFLDPYGRPQDAAYHIDLTGKQSVRSITDSLFTMSAIGDEGFFQANPQKYIEIQQVYTLHTLSNETKNTIGNLLASASAFYSTPPGPDSDYTQVTFRQGILDICSEVIGTSYDQAKPCVIRHEIQDSQVINPFFAHYVTGDSTDIDWLKNIIGTSTAADDLANGISNYRASALPNPRYNKGFWVYPAFQWPDRSILDISDYVFVIVTFSVKTDLNLPVRRRALLQTNNDMDEGRERDYILGHGYNETQHHEEEGGQDQAEDGYDEEDRTGSNASSTSIGVRHPQVDDKHQNATEHQVRQGDVQEDADGEGDGRRLLAHPRSRVSPSWDAPHPIPQGNGGRPKHVQLDHPTEHHNMRRQMIGEKKDFDQRLHKAHLNEIHRKEGRNIKDRRYRKTVSLF